MTWSERFSAYLDTNGLKQTEVAFQLRAFGMRVSQSQVHYWCRGSVPREATREQIAAWSQGGVPAETDEASTPTLDAGDSGEHPAVSPPHSNTA